MTKIKLVIWDLDNTLWNGTVYYKDKDAVMLKPGTKAALKELSKREIACSICSKNYIEDAEGALEKFEIKKYFEYPQIGWGHKSESIRKIAKYFNLPFGQILFIDDDAFQRAEVLSQIPELNVIELADPIDVLNIEGIIPENPTNIDLQRVKILKEQRDREQAESRHSGDYKEFLRNCELEMRIRKIKEADWPRVIQLLNRTNELNATSNRYSLDDLKKSHVENDDLIMVVELKDKFGEYGIIAETIIDRTVPNSWLIRDLTVSCRTMGRGIGASLLTAVMKIAKSKNIEKVLGYVNHTESNWRMKPLFEKRGFQKVSEDEKISNYEYVLSNASLPEYSEWINVIME